ncbi:Hypothetical predicted protein [Pelobates cultripes]|uniref:Uncharacterized protein n=1 Tax=Pelobates cultripes TaxID=61616 RepID=A0AAD1SGC3_PELCU|nr:Hypothetical predicted protein [Pelobates cultripes]
MGGGRKSKQGSVVAPIFRSHRPEEERRAEETGEYDSDSMASDMSRTNTTPITKDDLRGLLQDIKSNIEAEFTKHLAPMRAGLTDLVQRTSTLEDKMEAATSRANTHEQVIQDLRDQETRIRPTGTDQKRPMDRHRKHRTTRPRHPYLDCTCSRFHGQCLKANLRLSYPRQLGNTQCDCGRTIR